ncbi:MAG: efflux RND transporter periplasmic adaptor subunit [Flavobacteriaceae bacterium]|nr:efflux RND transporter periplasmic adaptor subunit [Flavobacteriaceae bacterium]MDG2314589.1 efflux RND transporter periplasmic adaptor subunit [Flavobacteriaceae bacterium]
MKKTIYLIIGILLLNACSEPKKQTIEQLIESGSLEQLQEKRKELVVEMGKSSQDLSKINQAINILDTTQKKALVSVFEAKPSLFEHYTSVQATVKTDQNMVLMPEFSGRVLKILTKEGERVQKGQVLAVIDDGGLKEQLEVLQSQFLLSKTLFSRQERLWKQNIGSEIEYLQAKTAYEAQLKSKEQLENKLDKTRVRAPFSGIVDHVIIEEGNLVAPGQSPLFRIINFKNMYVYANVPEKYLTTINKNTKATIEIPVLDSKFEAKVSKKGNNINTGNRSFRVEVKVPNSLENISPNLNAKMHLNDYSNTNALMVPQSVVSENASNQEYVFIAVDNKALQVFVETGRTQGKWIEIVSGLQPGMRVIEEGARFVRNQQPIKIIE